MTLSLICGVMGKILKIACTLVFILQLVSSQNWALDQLISNNYDKLEIPLKTPGENETLPINASITVNSFSLNEKEQSLKMDLFLCLNWTDFRLQSLDISPGSVDGLNINESIHLSLVKLTKFDSLWLPTVYFRNALSSSEVSALTSIKYMHVWPNEKRIKYCSRLSVNVICRLELANFPFDEHYCHLELESFEKYENGLLQINMEPLQLNVLGNSKLRIRHVYLGDACNSITGEEYNFQRLSSTSSNESVQSTYRYSCKYVTVNLVRNINYYVIRYYCPTFLIVAIAIANFWLPTNAWPARIMMTATVLLTLITTSETAYGEVPSNDVVSLYWWCWVCQFFVYMCLIEFAFALAWVHFINDKKQAKEAGKPSPDGYYFGKNNCYAGCGRCIGAINRFFFGPQDYQDPINRNKVDYFARILYPFLFLLFVLVYIVATIPVWARKWRW